MNGASLVHLTLLLAACAGKGESGSAVQGDSGGTCCDVGAYDSASPLAELCNGLDDDGDGEVDEGYPDADANGRADCLDQTCPALDLPAAETGDPDATCMIALEATDPWAPSLAWAVAAPDDAPAATNVCTTPVVGHLTDTNGDGVIDGRDTPNVAAVFFDDSPSSGGTLAVFDGATGAWLWGLAGVAYSSDPTIADVDGDGVPELLVEGSGQDTLALGPEGTLLWTAWPGAGRLPAVADLAGDESPELLGGRLGNLRVFSAEDGALDFTIDLTDLLYASEEVLVGDIDQDGLDQEILSSGRVFDSDGTLLWDAAEASRWDLKPALVQADSDPEAEIVWLGHDLTIWEHDGGLRARVSLSLDEPATPCAGDLDGDGQMEIAFANNTDLYAYEADGAWMWTAEVDDVSGAAGCVVADLDGDGADEVLFAGESRLTVFDGAMGTERFRWTDHSSATLFELPVVADVNGDGRAEIVLVSNATMDAAATALQVLEGGDAGWVGVRDLWPNRNYAVSNWDADGGVPAHPTAPWLDPGLFRGVVTGTGEVSVADLSVTVTDGCVESCTYGPIALGVQVRNGGAADAPAGVSLAVYAEEETGSRLVFTDVLPTIPGGAALQATQIDLAPGAVGALGLRVVVDDDGSGEGALEECDESNNSDSWSEVVCP